MKNNYNKKISKSNFIYIVLGTLLLILYYYKKYNFYVLCIFIFLNRKIILLWFYNFARHINQNPSEFFRKNPIKTEMFFDIWEIVENIVNLKTIILEILESLLYHYKMKKKTIEEFEILNKYLPNFINIIYSLRKFVYYNIISLKIYSHIKKLPIPYIFITIFITLFIFDICNSIVIIFKKIFLYISTGF